MPKATYEASAKTPDGIPLDDMPKGSFAVIIYSTMECDLGRIIMRNGAGVHMLDEQPYWPAPQQSKCRVRLLTSGKIIIDLDAK